MGMNGIPRAFSPSQFRQEFLDFKRKVEQQLSARTYVNLANITVTEGGTIDSSVGDKLTETVKDKIVLDGGNLGEGALDGQRMVGAVIETNATANRGVKIDDTGLRGYDGDGNRYMKADETGLEMTGSISTKGKTGETVPRDIAVRLTTVTRRPLGDGPDVANPALVFVTNDDQLGIAPGIYSPDGKRILISANSADGTGMSTIEVGSGSAALTAPNITLGAMLGGGEVTIGNLGFLGAPGANVNLLGNVKVNGNAMFGPWLDLPLMNGWKITNSNKMRPSYRTNGDTIEFRGSISGGTSNVICQMPTAVRALKEENKVIPQYNAGWVTGTVSVAPDGFVRLDTYATNVYSVNLDFSYSTSP